MLTLEQLKAELLSRSAAERAELQRTLQAMQDDDMDIGKDIPEELKTLLSKCTQNRSETLCCPHCGSIRVGVHKKVGRRRYKCKDCRKTFVETYGTLLYHCRLSVEQIRELINMTLHNCTISTIVKEMDEKGLKVTRSTAWYHRHKICEAIVQTEGTQDDFNGITEADEYYTPLSFIGEKDPRFFVEVLGRMPNHHRSREQRYEYAEKAGFSRECIARLKQEDAERDQREAETGHREKRKSALQVSKELNALSDKSQVNEVLKRLDAEQKKKRGISNQQVCILSCMDLTDDLYFNPTCVGRLEPKHLEQNIAGKFDEDSILVTDSHRAYKTFANKHKIPLMQIPSGKHRSGPYNLAKLNSCHSRLAAFMAGYKEVASKYIDHYVALFRWQDKHRRETVAGQMEQLLDMQTVQLQRENTGSRTFKNRPMPFDTKGLVYPCNATIETF